MTVNESYKEKLVNLEEKYSMHLLENEDLISKNKKLCEKSGKIFKALEFYKNFYYKYVNVISDNNKFSEMNQFSDELYFEEDLELFDSKTLNCENLNMNDIADEDLILSTERNSVKESARQRKFYKNYLISLAKDLYSNKNKLLKSKGKNKRRNSLNDYSNREDQNNEIISSNDIEDLIESPIALLFNDLEQKKAKLIKKDFLNFNFEQNSIFSTMSNKFSQQNNSELKIPQIHKKKTDFFKKTNISVIMGDNSNIEDDDDEPKSQFSKDLKILE